MQVSLLSTSLRSFTGGHSNLGVNQLDTRRFAGIFPIDISEVASIDCGGAMRDDDFAHPSRSQPVTKHDDHTPIPQVLVASAEYMDEHPISEDPCFCAIHACDCATECGSAEIHEGHVQIPDDQRSMCTIVTSVDSQSAMDMMWRPKPKVHMRLIDQLGLIQAQSQAIAMMHEAGLNATNKIRCRRRGCADILLGVEALKYHLHIHNIADSVAECDDTPFPPCEAALIHSICKFKTSKRNRSRSKITFGTRQKLPMTDLPSKDFSVGSPLPSHLSPRESFPETQHVPSFTTVAKCLVSDPTPSNLTDSVSICKNDEPTWTHSRDRRGSSVSASNLAVGHSPASSPDMLGPLASSPCTNPPTSLALNPTTDCENDYYIITGSQDAPRVSEELAGSRKTLWDRLVQRGL